MPKQRKKVVSLPEIEPKAAGIDLGATEIFVAVPADRDAEPVRCTNQRRTTGMRLKLIELSVYPLQSLIHHGADRPRRVFGWNPLTQGHIVLHRCLFFVFSTHVSSLQSLPVEKK
jgi:hypothetical protein